MPKRASPKKPLPHLAAAVFCERVLVENDGVATLVRIVDTLGLQIVQLAVPMTRAARPTRSARSRPQEEQSSPGAPVKAAPMGNSLQIYVALKSGDFVGKGEVKLRAFKPSGEELGAKQPTTIPIELKGGHHGANLAINIGMIFEDNGTYWFEVYFDDHLLTRMPLSVVVSVQTNQSQGEPA